ncbi:MucBP domain-containing protein [Isobaculum melis]|uniref:MucBP domain-containing protein n=1 Tax=Isobaculum melis TaxID=142588 RepID=A0A1H9SLW5_9LACT|nr:MucBP domain-containing protein [Isobaculum melis]SER86010.1 MucBP domain-containing protein [Isobaculum melis]
MSQLNKKQLSFFALNCFLIMLFVLTKPSFAEEINPSVKSSLSPLTYTIKREQEKFVLNEVSVQTSFGTVASITITMPAGMTLNLTAPTGWTTFNNPTDATINYLLTENNTPANVQAVLEQASFSINDEKKTQGKISISLSTEEISSWKDPQGITHYYKFVPAYTSWLDAYNAAKKITYKGLTGYLATITSEVEHDYIYNSIAKNPGWLGGTRMFHKDRTPIIDQDSISNIEDDYNYGMDNWYWANGPEAGKIFFIGKKRALGGYVPEGVYDGWALATPEPNNSIYGAGGNGEYVLQFALRGSKFWNDLANTNPDPDFIQGYFVEFSSYDSQLEIEENSYSANVPQLVKVQFLDQDTNELLATEEILQNTFSIDSTYDATYLMKTFKDYDLVNMPTNVTGTHQHTSTHTNHSCLLL